MKKKSKTTKTTNTKKTRSAMHAISMAAAFALACSSNTAAGTGTVTIETWGEEYIEDKIPVTIQEDGKSVTIIEDGWEVRYTKFLVNLRNYELADDSGKSAFSAKQSFLVDHKKPGRKQLFTSAAIEAKAYSKFSYEIAPVDASTQLAGADAADLALMKQGQYSIYVAGEFTKGTEKKTFEFGFTTATRYENCKAEVDGKEQSGVVVTNNGRANVELTIHGDHLVYDDLGPTATGRVVPRVEADANNDGKITTAELENVKILDLQSKYTGRFGVANDSSVVNLLKFEQALSRTIGHFNGEGECTARSL
jgi:hypothetical protein